MSEEIRFMVESLHQDGLSAAQAQRLNQLLRQDKQAAKLYVQWMHQHAALRLRVGPPLPAPDVWGDAGSPPFDGHAVSIQAVPGALKAVIINEESAQGTGLDRPQGMQRLPGKKRRHSWKQGLLIGSSIAAGLLIASRLLQEYRVASERQRESIAVAVTVASIKAEHDCVWSKSSGALRVGKRLNSGEQLILEKGVAQFDFNSGATLLVESPASFELMSGKAVRLHYGTVAVRANGKVKDFVVDSPDASIVDLGTSFGVHCDNEHGTDVEVFEGAVEVCDLHDKTAKKRVLSMGAAARIKKTKDPGRLGFEVVSLEQNHFGKLIELLWREVPRVPQVAAEDESNALSGGVIEAKFDDAPVPETVDTFYNAISGRGWQTPWVATGNPQGQVVRESPLSGKGDPYLRVGFYRSMDRIVGRSYGDVNGFDSHQPHVISWRWRFDGDLNGFKRDFTEQIYFYANPYFRRRAWLTNSWLIGVVGGNELSGRCREVCPMNWYVFNTQDNEGGAEFEKKNMLDTGLPLTAGVIYQFTVVVYPQEGCFDVGIMEGEKSFFQGGFKNRNRETKVSNVLHFGMGVSDEESPASFSLDSLRIEPLSKDVIESFRFCDGEDKERMLRFATKRVGE